MDIDTKAIRSEKDLVGIPVFHKINGIEGVMVMGKMFYDLKEAILNDEHIVAFTIIQPPESEDVVISTFVVSDAEDNVVPFTGGSSHG